MNIVLSEPDTSFKMNSEEGKMFVGGIKQDTTDEDFKEYFSKYGELTDCVLMKDQNTNRPRGFGFIRYKDQDDVRKVLEDSPHFLKGKRIDPKQCLPRNVSREMSRSGGGGIMGSGDAPLSQKIFIGGVGQTSEEDIQTEFGKYGNVLEVVLMMDKVTGNCRGFGFVTFDNEQTVNQLCERRYVTILEKRVEIKRAQPRDAQGGPPGGRIFNAGPMNQGGPPMGQGGPPMGAGGPPAGWNQGQGPGGWNQNQAASYGGAQPGGFNQQNNFGGNFGQQGGQPGGFGGQQQQQTPGPGGQYGNYNNQNQGQGGNTYGQTPQNYGGNYAGGQQQQQQQQQQPNNYGQPQQNYGNWQPQQQQQPNMYGNQGGGDGQAYGGQQNYGILNSHNSKEIWGIMLRKPQVTVHSGSIITMQPATINLANKVHMVKPWLEITTVNNNNNNSSNNNQLRCNSSSSNPDLPCNSNSKACSNSKHHNRATMVSPLAVWEEHPLVPLALPAPPVPIISNELEEPYSKHNSFIHTGGEVSLYIFL
ncbi:uncharacterized protein [Amphiura filiformis]|uniref:uncharacterized protein isoform X2 n=1 Tax=Amphiura filiformis TaxID=82378 RepID=UPI003B21EF85